MNSYELGYALGMEKNAGIWDKVLLPAGKWIVRAGKRIWKPASKARAKPGIILDQFGKPMSRSVATKGPGKAVRALKATGRALGPQTGYAAPIVAGSTLLNSALQPKPEIAADQVPAPGTPPPGDPASKDFNLLDWFQKSYPIGTGGFAVNPGYGILGAAGGGLVGSMLSPEDEKDSVIGPGTLAALGGAAGLLLPSLLSGKPATPPVA